MSTTIKTGNEPRLLQLLTDTQSAMARLFEARARHLGLSRPQWRIMSGLYGHSGLTQTELSERTSIARSPLGKIVDQLEAKGFVERRPDPEDRRVNCLYLTEAATPLIGPAIEVAQELEQSVLEGVTLRDSATELLDQLNERLQRLLREELYTATNN